MTERSPAAAGLVSDARGRPSPTSRRYTSAAVPLLKREPDVYPNDLFQVSPGALPWWVAHVRSRQEKALARHLLNHSVPYFLPQEEKQTRREGRLRLSLLPLFPGYVFFRGGAAERLTAQRSQVMVRALEVGDQPLLHGELETIRRLQAAGHPVSPHSRLGQGDDVEVVEGPLQGLVGTVLRDSGPARLVVSVTFLGQSVAAILDRDTLTLLKSRPAGRWMRSAR